ncbi:MAG: hypothetical protein KBD51_00515 [Candidatus Levybacteria bacterium]|nr:hypothetical protein [Candidatus Levybacteria bacterium]
MADNETKLSLENARRIAKILRPLSPQARNELLRAKKDGDFQEFQKVAFENRLDSSSVWTGIDDLWQQAAQGVEIPLDGNEQKPSDTKPKGFGIVGTGALATKALLDRKEGTYETFQEDSDKYAGYAHKSWEEEEKERLKNPGKFKPRPGRAGSAQEAYDRAHREYHEMFARTDEKKAKEWLRNNPTNASLARAINKVSIENKNLTYQDFNTTKNNHLTTVAAEWDTKDPSKRSGDRISALKQSHEEIHDHIALHSPKLAREWAQKYNDTELYAAIERKRLRDEAAAIQNQNRLSKALRRNPTRNIPQPLKPAQPIPPNTTAWTPIPANTFPGTLPPNTLKSAQTPTTQPPQGLRRRLTYYSPGQIRNRAILRVQNRIISSKAGQSFQKTRLGKLSSGLNRVNKKIKKLLNPLSYLLNLFKRSLIGSVASAIGGLLSSTLSAIAGGILGIGGTVIGITSLVLTKILTGIGVSLSTVSLPLVIIIAIIIFLVVTIFSIFFAPENEGDPVPESPYPGITYFILGPFEVPNGDSIDYNIAVLYDEEKATVPLSGISLISDVPPGTRLVSTGTTGTYVQNPAENNVSWDLSDNQPESTAQGVSAYQFTLRLDPDDDITVEVKISLLGAGAGGGGPPVVGGDCGGKYNSRNSERGNFGDPSCDHTKNAAADLMSQLDPANAPFWYLVAECESSHWPNAFNGNAVRASGAWGMYQMGVESVTSYPYTGGNLPWRQQTEVAFKRETEVAETRQYNNPFDYWQCETNACQDAPGMCTNGEYNVQGRTW